MTGITEDPIVPVDVLHHDHLEVANNVPVGAFEHQHHFEEDEDEMLTTLKKQHQHQSEQSPEFREALVPRPNSHVQQHHNGSTSVANDMMMTTTTSLNRGDSTHSAPSTSNNPVKEEGQRGGDEAKVTSSVRSSSTSSRSSSATSQTASLTSHSSVLSSLDSSFRSNSFTSSSQTSTNRLQLSEEWINNLQYQLYRRVDEETILLDAYQRSRMTLPNFHHRTSHSSKTLSSSTTSTTKASTIHEFVLISGPSGSGKTRLAHTLETIVQKDGGYFVTGKFDQVQRPTPYAALSMAFTQYAEQLVKQQQQGDNHSIIAEQQRKAIREDLGDNDLALLTSFIPALERIVGKPNTEFRAALTCQSVKRFVSSLGRFLAIFCSVEHPLVLLLDDLQVRCRIICIIQLLFKSCTQ